MKTFRNLFTNPWFLFAIVVYIGSLFVLSQRAEFSISEALIELVIFGIAFPLVAWLATIRARPLTIRVHPTGVVQARRSAVMFWQLSRPIRGWYARSENTGRSISAKQPNSACS